MQITLEQYEKINPVAEVVEAFKKKFSHRPLQVRLDLLIPSLLYKEAVMVTRGLHTEAAHKPPQA